MGRTPAGIGTAFRYRDALAQGATRAGIRRAVEEGRIARYARGVYASGTTRWDEIAAAVARLGGEAVASHETAAELWGLPLLGPAPATIQLTRPRRRTGTDRYPGLTVHHAAVPARHRTLHLGIPVTTPARTAVDIARVRPFRAGVSTADGALRLRRCHREHLLAVTEDCAGWPGVRRAREVAGFADARAANPLESISRVAFHEYRLPRPMLQAEVGGLAVVDFLWQEYGVVGEADGMGKYVDLAALHREKHRQENLEHDGLVVVRWTWRDAYRRPDALAHRVGGVLFRRGWRPDTRRPDPAWGAGW